MDTDNHIKLGRFTKDITGQQFGHLAVLGYEGKNNHGQTMWRCLCDCGKEAVVVKGELTGKRGTKTCGCSHWKHGMVGTAEYKTWRTMLNRCNDPENSSYGGRGIFVCERWKEFQSFFADMGIRPSDDHSIDRIDNDKGYECGQCPDCLSRGTVKLNCQWSTRTEQGRNKRNNVFLTHDGLTMTISAWSEKLGIGITTLFFRLRNGWSVADVLTRPVGKNGPKKQPSSTQP